MLAELLGIDAALPAIDYGAERAAIAIVRDAIARGVVHSCRAIGNGGMLTALARLAFDALRAGRSIGAEIEASNPLCEAGGFVCEIAGDAELDLSGSLRVGTTTAGDALWVNGVRFEIARLYESWSQPLDELYP